MIFVLGSGRSGTHWIGHILESHPDLHVTIEDERFFRPVTEMALDPRVRPDLFPKLIAAYQEEAARVAPRRFADKSHPNIWLAEELASALPTCRFVGIQRDPWGTVASMLNHSGVLSWHGRWREFPVPNQFLGLVQDMTETYDGYSTATKCALRWRSHERQMQRIQERLGNRLLVLGYEDLFKGADHQLLSLAEHLGLDRPFPAVETKAASLDQWRAQLAPEQLLDIEAIVGFGPPPTGTAASAGSSSSEDAFGGYDTSWSPESGAHQP